MSADPASKVVSIYLPDRAEAEAIAVEETARRGHPVSTGKILVEFILAGIAAYRKKHPKKEPAKPKAPKAKRRRQREDRADGGPGTSGYNSMR